MALNQTGRIDVVFNATAPLVKEYGPGKHAADLTTKEFMVPLTTIVKLNFIKAHAGVQCRSLGLAGAAQRLRARRFALAQYLKLPHVVVETWVGQQTPVDRPLAQLGAKRRVVLSVPFFSAAIFAVGSTDLVLTVPRKLTKIVRPISGVRLVEPPREIKAFPYFMTWHPRLNEESAHAWFREEVRVAARTI